MQRAIIGLCCVVLTAGASAAPGTIREARTRWVAPGPLPADLASPEGKTRWHLEDLALADPATVAVAATDRGFARAGVEFAGADAETWLLPERDPSQMRMGARRVVHFDKTEKGIVEHVTGVVDTVGIGWVHLPAGPDEVVLERAVVNGARLYRWVSPRKGILVESGDGGTYVVDSVSSAADLKIYADQLYRGLYTDIKYGYDARGSAVNPLPVSSLVPNPGINNICDLVNLNTWDFSAISSGQETATTNTPINAAETCNTTRCNGYSGYPPGGNLQPALLERLDRNLTGTVRKDHQVVQRENRATDVTFWLRAGTQNENVSGGFGSGETRFCFTDEGATNRNEVPLWQMPHSDAGGFYTQAGDTWTSVPLGSSCEQSFASGFSGATCGSGGTNVYSSSCTSGGQTFSGAQFSKVVKGGVVVLPSGHTLNAVVLRNTTEFCQFLLSNCSFLVNSVRTVVYYWQSPFVGSVALVRGPQQSNFAAGEVGETPCTNFTSVEFTDISYGLLPPVSITAGTVTGTTVNLSWNPGNDTHRINAGYKIYWDTDSGSASNYAFNSVANPAQVSFSGTSATISGLTPGTTYYFTVTSLSDFTDPASGVVTRYESIRYPTTVSGDPSFSYPIEVQATTSGGSCIPSTAVSNLTVGKGTFPNIQVCWTALADPCVAGYDVYASSVPGFGITGSVGLTTCWDGDPPPATLILLQVRARGTGGNGP